MKITIVVILTFLLGTMFSSLFYMSTDMNMTEGMTDCPFMTHKKTVCLMNFADHLSFWKSVFLAVAPTLTFLLAFAGLTMTIIVTAPNLILKPRYLISGLSKSIQERIYTFSYRPLQELFSNGILHPKLF